MFEEQRELINSKVKESKETKQTYVDAIRKADAAIEKQSEMITDSYDNADVKSYHKALDARREAEDIKGMYEKKLAEFESKPMLSEEEFAALRDSICEGVAETETETKERMKTIIVELYKICVEFNGNVRAAADLLHDLQFDVQKDDCCMKSGSGAKIYISNRDLSYGMKKNIIPLSHYVGHIIDELEREKGGKNYEPWTR